MRMCRSGKLALFPAEYVPNASFYFPSCCGAFMSAEDTKASRTDSPEHEYVALAPMTNYDGYVYWGEYPLSFAACLSQVSTKRNISLYSIDSTCHHRRNAFAWCWRVVQIRTSRTQTAIPYSICWSSTRRWKCSMWAMRWAPIYT